MKRTVRILRRAQHDLQEIERYVARDRPEAAGRLIDRLLAGIESLESFPNKDVVPQDERLAGLGYRVLLERDRLVFYKVTPAQVRIYRVLHGRRRYQHMV